MSDMISPTKIMQSYIDLKKSETRHLLKNGNLDCLSKGVLGLMESAGKGDMKAVDIVVNRIDGLVGEKVELKPVIVEIIDYGDK